jgi:hypothetical protein
MEAGEDLPASAPGSRSTRPPGLTWDWTEAALGAAYALPGAALILSDPARGLALCFGVLPAAIIGLAPRRRGRLGLLAIGVLSGVPMFVGGLLAGVPVLAVAAVALLAVAATLLAARSRIGQVAMVLSLPMVGIGLSYDSLGEAAGLAALMVVGSAFACLVSMLWPERPAGPANADTNVVAPTLGYGIRLGAAGASAAAIGFLFNLEHVGWACAAALLVMRPTAEMQRSRSVGRILAVASGALLAIGLVRLGPSNGWYGIAAIMALAGAAGTRRSRWYVTSAFTTFLVFLLLLYSDPQDAGSRFNERLVETVLGVGIAYLFGLALPKLAQRARPASQARRGLAR